MDVSIGWNADYIDEQYRLWKSSPEKVSREWRVFFEGFELGSGSGREGAVVCDRHQVVVQSQVDELIHRYRDLGHLLACLDPLESCPTDHPLLNLEGFGLSEDDLDRSFYSRMFSADGEEMPLRDIVRVLRETYCRSVGVEYMHLQDPGERRWLQERMEPTRNRPSPGREARLRMLNKLMQATLFEQFLHTRYVGQTRFSLEGAEGIIAQLDGLVEHAAEHGCREVILGMAHRGRLNVEVNIFDKLYEAVFCEFEGTYDPESVVGSGDVKYHKGYMADVKSAGGKMVRLVLVPNPSHLESVNPVVEGIARARQEQLDDRNFDLVLPLLIHGDAAFSGQGIVMETLNMSQLEGYCTGGTIHIVINNQIGFTTPPEDARSTRYSTDVAKMLMVPIFHVHGEDPEALVHVVRLAFDYRREFRKDVVIDVVCYRRFGHNEGDEPYYTQPHMYDRIKERPAPSVLYGEKLKSEGLVDDEEIERIRQGITQCLENTYRAAREKPCSSLDLSFYENWDGFTSEYSHDPPATGVAGDVLVSLARRINSRPEGFSIHPRLERILKRRIEAVESGGGIDWANAESLAFGSLLVEGAPIRLSGQDSRRGTFSQRHSMLVDTRTGDRFTALNELEENQARFSVYDSLLSEYGVLGFEYGYSLAEPRGLTIWEAQYGDFINNAQAIVDEYIADAEVKWLRMSGLVLLLPHGYEGQGPDHSSGRLERFLQLCAESNIQVCYPSTPAQYFHLLRRQVVSRFRKPLVIMTPKSLLRHPLAVSSTGELSGGRFMEIIPDAHDFDSPRRVLCCSGKIYYELLDRRQKSEEDNIAIVRIEQFYPFHDDLAGEVFSRYRGTEDWAWVQEEPQNMGGWTFIHPLIEAVIGREMRYMGRPPAASPATGFGRNHRREQEAIIDRAMEAR